ncbi:hypothetical protein HBH92_233960 [Parastagonospora nodorum]|nr:hypothetical protein HBI13_139850 [Parastagonospora nodorum]KAH4050582.1 hypothetical protein HBH49_134260 [Parastagonospora nodorum]KAH4064769.1 hypothetical protein HBH50_175210 [Parastagonospora nodorum]KAH4083951.1 hypothetical protein HBH48_172810 [Parastagonospora nodorum]KAH4164205.1 hypothetical protein HBH43_152180 [Parastagonospora nodorum]
MAKLRRERPSSQRGPLNERNAWSALLSTSSSPHRSDDPAMSPNAHHRRDDIAMLISTATKRRQDSNAVDQFVFLKREFNLVDIRASFDERSGASHVRSFGHTFSDYAFAIVAS